MPDCCKVCGYDLRATPDRCPECGTAADAYTLSITMLLGRLLPIVVVWWMALTTRDADVAVG